MHVGKSGEFVCVYLGLEGEGEYNSFSLPVILSQIVMVSPGTHLVKNCESQLKKEEKSSILKMLWPLCNRTCTGNLKTHSKTLYYSILKLKYSGYFKGEQRLKEICIVKQQPQ